MLKSEDKIILCVDMDAFFASVEQQCNPHLRGKPIAVVGSGARTVITTRSYEARAYGVKTGMTINEALKLCPHIIFVKGNNQKYTYTCSELKKIYEKYTPDLEIYSIDEAFLDITTTYHLFGSPEDVGVMIKQDVKERFGINCTIGIAPNILLAKLASDISKPDGLRYIKPEEVSSVLEDLPVKELWGIGNGISERLAKMGIYTCGQLARTPVSFLRNKFGIIGETLHMMGQGKCNRQVLSTEPPPKSIGHSYTLPADITDIVQIKSHLMTLSEMVGRRARRHGLQGKRVSLTVRYCDFSTFSKHHILPDYTSYTNEIYQAVLKILQSFTLIKPVRLLAVTLSELTPSRSQQYLFEDVMKQKAIFEVIDKVNDKFGEFFLAPASCLKGKRHPTVIAPAWRPDGVRHTDTR